MVNNMKARILEPRHQTLHADSYSSEDPVITSLLSLYFIFTKLEGVPTLIYNTTYRKYLE